MNDTATKVSKKMQEIAHNLDAAIQDVAGERIPFTLVIYTPERANYLSTVSREESIKLLKGLLGLWEEGMPDIPAHEYQS